MDRTMIIDTSVIDCDSVASLGLCYMDNRARSSGYMCCVSKLIAYGCRCDNRNLGNLQPYLDNVRTCTSHECTCKCMYV